MKMVVTAFILLASNPSNQVALKEARKAKASREGAKAVQILTPLSDSGDPEAIYELGLVYMHWDGNYDIAKDVPKGWNLICSAADQGFAIAQVFRGRELSNPFLGHDIEKDAEEGAKWLRKGAEQGNVEGMWLLARAYMWNDGLKPDPTLTIFWATKAARLKSVHGMSILGQCYEQGFGVLQDWVDAYAWYSVASLVEPVVFLAKPGSNLKPSWVNSRDKLAAKLAPAQMDKAQARAKALAKELGLLNFETKK